MKNACHVLAVSPPTPPTFTLKSRQTNETTRHHHTRPTARLYVPSIFSTFRLAPARGPISHPLEDCPATSVLLPPHDQPRFVPHGEHVSAPQAQAFDFGPDHRVTYTVDVVSRIVANSLTSLIYWRLCHIHSAPKLTPSSQHDTPASGKTNVGQSAQCQ